ncbi:hypothetical protein K7X08_002638 [Anisodus acutangulus]|uniref:Uncharacterized protein n=1 Tax=Anisodus acutangulus TaxID=402998 RepID=A0A9Q1R6G8_9SOLA|nr:hypothetical protein K7X08_002638 [Anisodus acutangulus]
MQTEKLIERMVQRGLEEQSMYQVEEFLMSNIDESGIEMPKMEQQISIWSTDVLTEINNQQKVEVADSCVFLVQEGEYVPIFNWIYDASIIQQEQDDSVLLFNSRDWRVAQLLLSLQ